MRSWHTVLTTEGGVGSRRSCITSYKTYNLKLAGEVMNKVRSVEEAAGLPKRKINPISVYLLEGLIQTYFKSCASKGDILISIDIEERNG